MALPTVEIICVQCGRKATKFRTGGKPARYCGNACKIAAARAARPDALRRYRAAEAAKYVPKARKPRAKATPKPKTKACRDCGVTVSKSAQRCAPCRAKAEQRIRDSEGFKAARRSYRLARKVRERAARIETFDPFEVLNRDGWRCHLCGCSTPKSLRGTYHDRAPELDHIVPLAAGGEHSRLNTACACRNCNGRKSDKPMGQMRLVA